MAANDKPTMILGSSFAPGEPIHVLPGSVKYSCFKCRGDAWISPVGQNLLKTQPHVKVFCQKCFLLGRTPLDADGEIKVITYSKEILSQQLGSEEEAEKAIRATKAFEKAMLAKQKRHRSPN